VGGVKGGGWIMFFNKDTTTSPDQNQKETKFLFILIKFFVFSLQKTTQNPWGWGCCGGGVGGSWFFKGGFWGG